MLILRYNFDCLFFLLLFNLIIVFSGDFKTNCVIILDSDLTISKILFTAQNIAEECVLMFYTIGL